MCIRRIGGRKMGKQFNRAKRRIAKLEAESKTLRESINELRKEQYEIDKKRRKLQLKWYGVADGDVASVSSLEQFIKATKRWYK